MKIRMRATVSGSRDGVPWPGRGEVVDIPDDEAAGYCAIGLAEPVPDEAETAVAPAPEVRKRPDPKVVRAWAKAEGLEVPDKGPIPAELAELYAETQP